MNTALAYFLGHTDLEIERLQLQAGIVGGITRRLISESGIKPGMRVLEIGCGVGDVSMLLAEAVGDGGSVVAFDREARAIEVGRARAVAAGYRQIEFVVAADDAFPEGPCRCSDWPLYPGSSGRSCRHDTPRRSHGTSCRRRCLP